MSKLDVYQKITVDLKMDELDVTAAENKATYEEIREYVKEHTGLNVSNLYILHRSSASAASRSGRTTTSLRLRTPSSSSARRRRKKPSGRH